MKKNDNAASHCEMVADLHKELDQLRRAKVFLAKTLKRRNVALFVVEHNLIDSAADIMQALHEVVVSAHIFEKTMKDRCGNDPDVVQAQNLIAECIEHSNSFETSAHKCWRSFQEQ